MTFDNIIWNVFALISITIGTLYQRRYCSSFDLRMGSFIQFAASAVLSVIFAFAIETRQIEWNSELIVSLVWAILFISIGAVSLLFILIRQGDATKVSSLMYLTPPTTAILAWLFFRESLTPLIVLGTVITSLGVLLVNQPISLQMFQRQTKVIK